MPIDSTIHCMMLFLFQNTKDDFFSSIIISQLRIGRSVYFSRNYGSQYGSSKIAASFFSGLECESENLHHLLLQPLSELLPVTKLESTVALKLLFHRFTAQCLKIAPKCLIFVLFTIFYFQIFFSFHEFELSRQNYILFIPILLLNKCLNFCAKNGHNCSFNIKRV